MSETVAPTYTVTTAESSYSEGSLTWAIQCANSYKGEGVPTIEIASSLAGQTVRDGWWTSVSQDVQIVNQGQSPIFLDLDGVEVQAGVHLSLGAGFTLLRRGSRPLSLGENAVLTLQNTRVQTAISLCPTSRLEGDNVTFSEHFWLQLRDWVGSPSDAFSGISSLEHELEWLQIDLTPAGDCSLGAIPALEGVEVIYVLAGEIPADATVTLEEGCRLDLSGPIIRGVLDCKAGSMLRDGGVRVADGGVLKLTEARVEAQVGLEPGGHWEGTNVTFAEDFSLVLYGWGGDTAELFADIHNASFEGEVLNIDLMEELQADVTLSALPGVQTVYDISFELPAGMSCVAEKGVAVGSYWPVSGTLELQPGAVLQGVSVAAGGVLKLNGARVEGGIEVENGARMLGEDVTFAEGASICQAHWGTWTAESLSSLFAGLSQVQVEAGRLKVEVGYSGYDLPGDTTLVGVPGVPLEYHLSSNVTEGRTVTLGEGAVLASSAVVHDGGTLVLNGARVESALYLYAGARIEGAGVTFAEGGELSLYDWSGSTAELFSGLRQVSCEGNSLRVVLAPQGDCTLTSLSGVKTDFHLSYDGVKAGYTVRLEQGARLCSWNTGVYGTLDCLAGSVLEERVTVYEGGVLTLDGARSEGELELQEGAQMEVVDSVLKGNITVASGGVLKLSNTLVEGRIHLEAGARIEGTGNVFTLSQPLEMSGGGDLSGLTGSTFAGGTAYVPLNGSSAGGTLSLLPEPFRGYLLDYAWLSVDSLCFAEGVDLYVLSDYANGGGLSGTISFAGQNNIYFLDYNANEPYAEGKLYFSGEGTLVDLGNATVHGTLVLEDGAELRAEGARFLAAEALLVELANWDGATAPSWLSSLTDCQFEADSCIRYQVEDFGGQTLTWNEAAFQQNFRPDGCPLAELKYLKLGEGDHLILPANTAWEARPILVGSGATLECGTGCSLEGGGISWVDDDGDISYYPTLVVADGGTLVADKLSISDTLVLSPGAKVTGSLHFEKGASIRLMGWRGSTQQLLDSVLKDASWTSDEPLSIEIFTESDLAPDDVDGSMYLYPGAGFYGEAELVDLGSRFGDYIVTQGHGYGEYPVTVQEGVDIVVTNYLAVANMSFAGNNVVRPAEPGSVARLSCIYGGGAIEAHGTRFEVRVLNLQAGSLSGENITFAADVPFGVDMGDEYEGRGWDGTAASLSAAIEAALQEVEGYTIEAKNPLLGVSCMHLTQDVHFSAATMADIVPTGFSGLSFGNFAVSSGRTVSFARGTTLDACYIYVDGTLTLESGAQLVDSTGDCPCIYQNGVLSLTGVDLNGACIYLYGSGALYPEAEGVQPSLTLTNCRGKGELVLTREYEGSFRVTGCDLSQVTIVLQPDVYGQDGTPTIYDFSGNYWGTTDLEAIKAKIAGYDESLIIIGDVLASAPARPEEVPPQLTLLAPETQKLAEGKSSVTLCWQADEAESYELRVDGKLVYRGAETRHELTLGDGEHRYSVKATNAAGKSSTVEGEPFTLDATGPQLHLYAPEVDKAEVEGYITVSLSWSADESAHYQVEVDGELMYEGSASSCTLTLEDGEHCYRITATDAHGNSSEETDAFRMDNSVPRITEVIAPAALANAKKGKAKVTLAWACSEPGASFTVVVDGKAVYSGSKTSCTLQLTDEREHHYTIIATDAEGNTSAPKSGSFRFDATAPVLKLQPPTFTRAADGLVAVSFAWSGHEEGLLYTLTLDKEATPIWEGSSPHPTLTLPDGKHSYTLTATDAAGNSTTLKGQYAFDATAPALTINPIKLKTSKKDERVTATLSWKGESGCSYVVRVGDEEFSTGSKASYAYSFAAGESFSYQVIATDKAGNATTSELHTVRCDVAAPELGSLAHEMTLGADGLPQLRLCWRCEDESAVSYTIKVDGKAAAAAAIQDDGGGWFSYVHTSPLKGGKHSYELTATDEVGNKSVLKGKEYAFTTPKLTLGKPKLSKAGEGEVYALLSWKGDAEADYKLMVDGEEMNFSMGSKGSFSSGRVLADGLHHYRVVAENAQGLYTVAEGSFDFDATAPLLSLGALSGSVVSAKGKETVKALLSWEGEEGVSYTITMGKKKVYSGKGTSCTYSFEPSAAEGHVLTFTAKDTARNISSFTARLQVSVSAAGEAELAWSSFSGLAAEPMAASALEQELALSAGSYALPEQEGGVSMGDCALAAELALEGRKQSDAQTTLASLA